MLEIEDRGLGMSDDELVEANERLANPPMVDFALSRMLGLYVVARLAQRYNIKVQLRHSWYGGITALVLLPPTVAVRAPMPEAIEAPSRRGPAELVPSIKPAEPAAEAEGNGEHLPIFEAARSDWFEDSVRADHLPLRRHAAQQPNGRAAEPTGNGAGTLGGAGATRTPGADRPSPTRGGGQTDAAEPTRCGRRRCGSRRRGSKRPGAEATRAAARIEATRPGGDGDGDGRPVTERPRTARAEAVEAGRRRRPRPGPAPPADRQGGPAAGRRDRRQSPTARCRPGPGSVGPAVRGRGAVRAASPQRVRTAARPPPAGRAAAPSGSRPTGPRQASGPARGPTAPAPDPEPGPAAAPAADAPDPAPLQAPRSRRPRPACPAGCPGRTSPPGWSPRGPRQPPPARRPQTAPSPPPPRPGPRRKSGACCRATVRASSAAG